MKTKIFEIRDEATHITAIATKLEGDDFIENAHLKRAGFGDNCKFCFLVNLETKEGQYDPFVWQNRTMFVAHRLINDKFDILPNCGLIDVKYELGESANPCKSEIFSEVQDDRK